MTKKEISTITQQAKVIYQEFNNILGNKFPDVDEFIFVHGQRAEIVYRYLEDLKNPTDNSTYSSRWSVNTIYAKRDSEISVLMNDPDQFLQLLCNANYENQISVWNQARKRNISIIDRPVSLEDAFEITCMIQRYYLGGRGLRELSVNQDHEIFMLNSTDTLGVAGGLFRNMIMGDNSLDLTYSSKSFLLDLLDVYGERLVLDNSEKLSITIQESLGSHRFWHTTYNQEDQTYRIRKAAESVVTDLMGKKTQSEVLELLQGTITEGEKGLDNLLEAVRGDVQISTHGAFLQYNGWMVDVYSRDLIDISDGAVMGTLKDDYHFGNETCIQLLDVGLWVDSETRKMQMAGKRHAKIIENKGSYFIQTVAGTKIPPIYVNGNKVKETIYSLQNGDEILLNDPEFGPSHRFKFYVNKNLD
jgi:hypothetical protein